MEFTKQELEAIQEALGQAINDGFADSDEDPIVTALVKVEQELEARAKTNEPQ